MAAMTTPVNTSLSAMAHYALPRYISFSAQFFSMKVAFMTDTRLQLRLSITVATMMSDAFCFNKMSIHCMSAPMQVNE